MFRFWHLFKKTKTFSLFLPVHQDIIHLPVQREAGQNKSTALDLGVASAEKGQESDVINQGPDAVAPCEDPKPISPSSTWAPDVLGLSEGIASWQNHLRNLP